MKKILQAVSVAILCFGVTTSYAQVSESSQALVRNYADVLINSSNVNNPQNAVDGDLTNYAVLQTNIGVANTASLKLGWSQLGSAGQVAVVEIQNDGGILSLDVLQTISLFLFDDAGNKIERKAGFDFTDVTVGDDPSRYKIRTTVPDDAANVASIKIMIRGLAAVQNRLRVYYAYLVAPTCPLIRGDILHAQHNVQNAGNAISVSKTDYATLVPQLLDNTSYLDIAFSQPGKAGKNVGFLLGEGTAVLSLSLLQDITVTVYDTDGGVVVSKSDFVLADAEVLGGGRFNLYVKTPKGSYQIGRGRITFTDVGLATLKVFAITAHQDCTAKEAVASSNSSPLSGVQVYPNPFRSYTTLNMKGVLNTTSHIIISDKTGSIIEERTVAGAATLRLLEKATPGVYFIKIITGDLTETRTVIKL